MTTTTTAAGSNGATPLCTLTQLKITAGETERGLGNANTVLVFTNTGATCRLTGFPGVDAVRSDGLTVHATRNYSNILRPGPNSPPRIVLPTGASASTDIHTNVGNDNPNDGCQNKQLTAFVVTPPDLQDSVRLPADQPSCYLGVGPLVPGTRGFLS